MLKARDIMNSKPPFCLQYTPIEDISKRFSNEGITGMMVVDEEHRLLGMITESDLIDQQARLHVPTALALFDMVIPIGEKRFEQELQRLRALNAENLMQEDVQTIAPDDGLDHIASLMADEHVHHLPVIEDDEVLGLITKHDVICALVQRKPIACI